MNLYPARDLRDDRQEDQHGIRKQRGVGNLPVGSKRADSNPCIGLLNAVQVVQTTDVNERLRRYLSLLQQRYQPLPASQQGRR